MGYCFFRTRHLFSHCLARVIHWTRQLVTRRFCVAYAYPSCIVPTIIGMLFFADDNVVDGLQLFVGVVVDNNLAAFALLSDIDTRAEGLLELVL